MAIVILTAIVLSLNGILWYLRPSGDIWLFGSLFLGIIWGLMFLRLIPGSKP